MLDSGFRTEKPHIWRKLTQKMKEKEIKKTGKGKIEETPVSRLHMLKVVKGFEVCGREFAGHWVDQLAIGVGIVGIHLNLWQNF